MIIGGYMAKRIGGSRRKTRHITKKPAGKKGKISIRKALQKLKPGQKVLLNMESAVQKGVYYRRFHGRTGIIEKEKGNSYIVRVKDGKMNKTLTVRAIHLRKL